MICRQLWVLSLLGLLGLVLSPLAQAAEVGSFTQVEGQVELLKSGQPAATPAAAQTGVEVKDSIRTGADSRAQLRFLDDTSLTIAPLSQITIETYMYDASQGKRQALLAVSQGLVHAVVSKIFPGPEPDFSVKTQTAVMGVRGTEFYLLVIENPEPPSTSGLPADFFKALRVRALEVPPAPVSTDVFVKSGRVVMGSSNPDVKETVVLEANQSVRVPLNRPPGQRLLLAAKDFQRLRSSLVTGVRPALIGRTRNPRELLQRLPVTPPRLKKPAPGAGSGPGRSGSAPPLKPGAAQSRMGDRLPKPAMKPPTSPPKPKEKPAVPGVKPLKPGEKPPLPASKLPPKGEPPRVKGPLAPKKEPSRAAPPKPPGEASHLAPNTPRQREPARGSTASPPRQAAPPGAAPPPKPGLPEN